MKQLITLLFLSLSLLAFSQEQDTSIYTIVDEMPRFPGCEELDTTLEVKIRCAETSLLLFFNRNIVYPLEARQQEIEGTVVMSMVVEKDGYISDPKIIKDIGGGTGEEAIRVANGMNDAMKQVNIAWRAGRKEGKPVRTRVTVPIRFKLQDPSDFVLVDQIDTVYVIFDDSLAFKDGHNALENFVESNLQVPDGYQDSCKVGTIDMTLLVRPSGYVRVLDLTDYWGLGHDYWWEAIKAATSTWGQWNAATNNGRQVPASYDLSIDILPESPGCQQLVTRYEKAVALADEGSLLYNEGQSEEGIARLTEAIDLFPGNANFLYLRGQAYMNMNKNEEACADFRKVQAIVSIGMVDQLVPFLCKQ